MATTTYLTSNFGSGTDDGVGQKSTHSVWIKRTDPAGDSRSTIISGMNNDSNNYMKVRFADNDRLQIYGIHSGVNNCNVETKAEFRDVSGWYHVVLQIDTTNATASERIKWYINGELQELNTATYPSAGEPNYLTISDDLEIGRNTEGDNEHFDGTMSHFHGIDGTIYAPTAFGEYDANGVWKIKTSPSVTYGTNGFFILKDGNSVTDQSGNSNNFTVAGGTLTNTEDSPSNVFATFNPLYSGGAVYSNGNLTSTISLGSDKFGGVSTIGVSSGKWYAEFKALSDTTNNIAVGIYGQPGLASNNNQAVGKETDSIGYRSDGSKGIENTFSSYGASYTTNDIIGVALDLDSGTKTITFYKNGASQGAITISLTPDEGFWFLSANSADGAKSGIWSANFGNGYFGTTAVASAGTNASGIGIFEYDVPTGYTALSTKGLNL
jgi:hypothetical protein